MKRILLIASFTIFSFAAMANSPFEPLDKKVIENMTEEQRIKRVELLEKRVAEIKEMPLKDLERSERKALRKEVRAINKETKALQGAGIYISGGALLVALILLLILL